MSSIIMKVLRKSLSRNDTLMPWYKLVGTESTISRRISTASLISGWRRRPKTRIAPVDKRKRPIAPAETRTGTLTFPSSGTRSCTRHT